VVTGTVVTGTVVGGTVVAGAGVSEARTGAVSEDDGESAPDVCEHADRDTSALDMHSHAIPVRIEVIWKPWGEKTVVRPG